MPLLLTLKQRLRGQDRAAEILAVTSFASESPKATGDQAQQKERSADVMASSVTATYHAGKADFPFHQRQQSAGVSNGVAAVGTSSTTRDTTVASIAPEIARLQSLDLDPELKAVVSHAEQQRKGLDSQTGLQCTWLDVFFHISGAGALLALHA